MDKLTGKSLLEKLEEVSEESRRDQVDISKLEVNRNLINIGSGKKM